MHSSAFPTRQTYNNTGKVSTALLRFYIPPSNSYEKSEGRWEGRRKITLGQATYNSPTSVFFPCFCIPPLPSAPSSPISASVSVTGRKTFSGYSPCRRSLIELVQNSPSMYRENLRNTYNPSSIKSLPTLARLVLSPSSRLQSVLVYLIAYVHPTSGSRQNNTQRLCNAVQSRPPYQRLKHLCIQHNRSSSSDVVNNNH